MHLPKHSLGKTNQKDSIDVNVEIPAAIPVLGWNPDPKRLAFTTARLIPFEWEICRSIQSRSEKTEEQLSFSAKAMNGLKWTIGPDPIEWVDENGKPNPISLWL